MLKITDLRCEYEHAPLGLTTDRPRFSWKLESDKSCVVQASRRIQVAADPGFGKALWDSGEVRSAECRFVDYAGAPCAPRTRYFYRVQAADASGERSAWSEASWFETSRLGEAWEADFITPDLGPDAAASSRPRYLRREFVLPAKPASARAYVTALGVYELRVNGQRVGDAELAPGWTAYPKRLAYKTYDIGPLLREGKNAVAALLGGGWYKGWVFRSRNFYGELCALSAELRSAGPDGTETVVRSDESWKCADGPLVYAENYHGETYDARLEMPGWDEGGFDDGAWERARKIPFDASVVVPQDGPSVKRLERLKAIELFTAPNGETVVDFGQNLAGRVRFSVKGKAGDRVVLSHAETLDAAGNFYTENLRAAKNRVEYILKGGGTETFEPLLTQQGFRYARIDEYPGKPDPADFEAVVLQSDLETTLSFECSNPLLDRLHRNILWGWRGNSVDIPTDCPQRDERLGWTGDAEVFIGTAAYLQDVGSFFRKWLRDLAAEQKADGGVPHVVPDAFGPQIAKSSVSMSAHSSTGWGDAAVVCPWTLYARYADKRLLEEQYPSMKGWIEYIRARAAGGLIWDTDFHYGDWVALDAKEGSFFGATPNDLTATAFYAYSAGLLAEAARVLGKTKDAEDYDNLHGRIVEAFRNEFITPAGRLGARTQTAHILALVFGLARPDQRDRAAADLSRMLAENGGHLTTGFLGTPFICRALSDQGRLAEAYELLLKDDFPSWLYQITKGATTVWEHWDGLKPDGTMWNVRMNSFNHYAYGAVGQWMYETIAGLSPDPAAPGFKSFYLKPQPGGGLDRCSIAYDGPYGRIESAWKIEGGRFSLDCAVPANSGARVVLSGVPAGKVKVEAPAGIPVPRFADGESGAEAVLGSGRWRLSCPDFSAPRPERKEEKPKG